jgi:hypothetical protein
MNKSLTILLVEKNGSLKTLSIKNFNIDELYKKCGFKKAEDFYMQHEWSTKIDGQRYSVQMYGKIDGKANSENKYDFPPPIDNQLFFGTCALVGLIRDDNHRKTHIHLTIDIWNKIYEKLFGGFEDLITTNDEDEHEEDELEHVPKQLKTKKGGYLKDGFVIDSSDTEENVDYDDDSTEDNDNEDTATSDNEDNDELSGGIDIGSELSEESYIE